ncbi:MAG TPA: CopD family protein, partial [Jatrophihabitans sp.]|nr:CopD family protein [Jatrophihabitans sp.]
VLVGSGLVQAWYQVREWGALTGTHYGHLLITKTALVAVILAAAVFSRRWVRHNRQHHRSLRGLLASVTVEVATAVAVVAVTAALTAASPARSAYRPPVELTVHAGPVTVQISTVSAGARAVDLHVYTFDRAGLVTDVRQLHMTAERPGGQHGARTVDVPLRHVGNGHFIAPHWVLPSTGRWRLQLTVQISDLNAYVTDAQLPIR